MKLRQWLINLVSDSQTIDDKIRAIFFTLIKNNQGSITEMDLAMAANISGTDAKKYLERFAVEFEATFDVTEKGQIVYLFPFRKQNTPEKSASEKEIIVNDNSRQNTIQNGHQTQQQSATTSKNRAQNLRERIKYQVADVENNLTNVENELQDNLKNVEQDLKKIGDSLNNLFKP